MRRVLGIIVGVFVLLVGLVTPAAADTATEVQLGLADLVLVEETMLDERLQELTFTTPALDAPTKVRVLLPDGYGDDHDRRYPVLYLLHGGFGSYLDWTTAGDASAITAGVPLIVVMPDSGPGWGYVDWWNDGAGGPPMWETYHVDQLVPWVDERYRTTGDRDGRAIAGLSMGGYGAMHYASRHPDLFTAAAAFSGAVDTNTLPVQLLIQFNPFGGDPGPDAVYGPRLTEEVRWRGHNPWDLAANLEGLFLQLDTGNGLPGGPGGDTGDPIEAACWQMMTNLHRRLDSLGYPHVWNDYGAGGHTWWYWQRDMRQLLPRLMDRFAAPAPAPSPFTYTSIDPAYSVWGWRVAIDRPATEFTTLSDADAGGFSLTGSGAATVTTGPVHEPGATYTLTIDDADGRRVVDAIADDAGRLTVAVSLGPANTEQQHTLPGTAAALTQGSLPGTWPSVTANVIVEPAGTSGVADAGDDATAAGRVETLAATPASLPATGLTAPLPVALLLAVVAVVCALVRRAAATERIRPTTQARAIVGVRTRPS